MGAFGKVRKSSRVGGKGGEQMLMRNISGRLMYNQKYITGINFVVYVKNYFHTSRRPNKEWNFENCM